MEEQESKISSYIEQHEDLKSTVSKIALCLFAPVQRSLEEVSHNQNYSQGIQETNQTPCSSLHDSRVSVEKHIRLSRDRCWFYL